MANLSALKMGGNNAGPMRAALGLATDDAVTFGSLTLGTALAVAQGGTGATAAATARTNLGLGTAAVQNTGTSGANVPLLNGANTWSAVQDLAESQALRFQDSSVGYRMYATAGLFNIDVQGIHNAVQLSHSAFIATRAYTATTASAANVHVTSAGQLQRSTSAKKYKRDWEPISDQYLDAFYEIAKDNAVWYRPNGTLDPSDWSYYGFLADPFADEFPQLVQFSSFVREPFRNTEELEGEELATAEAAHEAAQDALEASYEPEVEGFAYERVSAFNAQAIVKLRGQVAARDAVIADLKSRLEALEAIVGVNDE